VGMAQGGGLGNGGGGLLGARDARTGVIVGRPLRSGAG